ncbi:MAG: hypothetical protein K1X89_15345 [Myxococcaceae bacterium]|nr:hypothetical protein [Myxococcaceae bacterium]
MLLALAACAPLAPALREGQLAVAQEKLQVSPVHLENGRQLFVHRCGGCHATPSVDELKPDEWREELKDMAPRARLSPQEAVQIYQYLWAAAQP